MIIRKILNKILNFQYNLGEEMMNINPTDTNAYIVISSNST